MNGRASHKTSKRISFLSDKIAAGVLTLAFGLLVALGGMPRAALAQSGNNPKYASIVVDAASGEILHSRYADKSLHPASTAKIMTLLLTFDAIESGKTSLRDRVYISQKANNMSPSKLGLGAGASIRVEDAIYALVTKSANDIAVALAEHIGGSEANFAAMMNRKAQSLGMTRTHFVNASGLHNPRQVSTVRDMAKLGRVLIYQYPKYYGYFSTKNFSYKGVNYRNHNRLMETYKGMDGLKTGFIGASGFNLVASAKRGDTRLIAVVFGGKTSQSRNAHMKELLDAAFARKGLGPSSVVVASNSNVKGGTSDIPVPGRKPQIVSELGAPSALASAGNAAASNAAAANAPAQPSASIQAASLQAKAGQDAQSKPSQNQTAQALATDVNAGVAPAPMQLAAILPLPSGASQEEALRWSRIGPMLQNKAFARLIGEGDIDPAAIRRLETGYLAMAAVKGEFPHVQKASLTTGGVQTASLTDSAKAQTSAAGAAKAASHVSGQAAGRDWSIQIGAYSSRVKTDAVLQTTLASLPSHLRHGSPVIAPLRSGDGWLFRGRLSGYSKSEAESACKKLSECLPIGPQAR